MFEMRANQKQEQRSSMLTEKEQGNCSKHAIIKGGFLEENGVRNYQL